MAAMGVNSLAAEFRVIKKNPETSQGKSVISDRVSTAKVISKAIQNQLEAMPPNMMQETLAKKILKYTASSSQTKNTSSRWVNTRLR